MEHEGKTCVVVTGFGGMTLSKDFKAYLLDKHGSKSLQETDLQAKAGRNGWKIFEVKQVVSCLCHGVKKKKTLQMR